MAILDSPSAQRNKEPIWNILSSKVIPLLVVKNDHEIQKQNIRVLEIAAGCGVHTEYFAQNLGREFNSLWYLPTDPEVVSQISIQERIKDTGLDKMGVCPAVSLTLNVNGFVEESSSFVKNDEIDLILCINMIHISPWEATVGLMKEAQKKLRKGGVLFCYGPYKQDGTAVESNLNFDRSLKSRDASWGIRDLEQVQQLAKENGLECIQTVEMPANNLSVLFQKL